MCHWNFSDLLESPYSFEISQNLTTLKTGKNTLKMDAFKNLCNEERQFFLNEAGM